MTTHQISPTFFCGSSEEGLWKILNLSSIAGEPLAMAPFLNIYNSVLPAENGNIWQLKGVASHVRYTTRLEKQQLESVQAGLGRPEATMAALIPIKKSDQWWGLTQEERRIIFEEKSQHISSTMKYLPAISRKLYHSRDLGEPFDFLTWFEFSPENEKEFNNLLSGLRSSEEWKFVTREVDIRLSK